MTVKIKGIGNYLDGHIWKILPSELDRVTNQVRNIEKNIHNIVGSKNFMFLMEDESTDPSYNIVNKTLVFDINGVLIPRADAWDQFWGYSGTLDLKEEFESIVDQIIENDNSIEGKPIERIILRIDSPGGVGIGAYEFVNSIQKAKANGIDIVTYTETKMASLGYLIGCCNKIYSAPSAIVGSIGSKYTFFKYRDNEAYDVYTISRGDLKSVGDPYSKLTSDELKFFETWIEADYQEFVNYVAEVRNKPVEEVIATKSGYSPASLTPWFVDEIIMNINEIII